ncbi:hypothetical protein K439DRAFT_1637725 [Ramaria rubella]|nr:hypothetical protein K439DRAFT_1637725 [Ramaria rubella]
MHCIIAIVSVLLAAAQAVVAAPIILGTHLAKLKREFTSSLIHIHAWLCSWMLVILR